MLERVRRVCAHGYKAWTASTITSCWCPCLASSAHHTCQQLHTPSPNHEAVKPRSIRTSRRLQAALRPSTSRPPAGSIHRLRPANTAPPHPIFLRCRGRWPSQGGAAQRSQRRSMPCRRWQPAQRPQRGHSAAQPAASTCNSPQQEQLRRDTPALRRLRQPAQRRQRGSQLPRKGAQRSAVSI